MCIWPELFKQSLLHVLGLLLVVHKYTVGALLSSSKTLYGLLY